MTEQPASPFKTVQEKLAGLAHRLSGKIAATVARERQVTEFLPAALEIIETPPAPAARAIGTTLVVFSCLALLWACFGEVDVIAIAPGKIVAAGHTKQIQALEAGVVRAIHVQDGQAVKAGDILLEIDPTINEAEQARIKGEYLQARLDVARLKASIHLDGTAPATFIPPEDAPAADAELQRRLLQNEMDEIRAKLAHLSSQIAQSEGNLHAVDSTIAKITEALPLLRQRADIRRTLSQKGYGSKIEKLNAQQALVEQEKELEVQKARSKEAEAALAALHEQRKQAEAEYLRTRLSSLAEAEQKVAALKERLVQAEQKTRLQTLNAPVDGTVQQLAVHTEGGVVTPAQILLVVVPAGSGVEIEAMIANKDIGFVHAGQSAQVKVNTFSFTKYGLLQGTVLTVSQDAVTAAGRDAGASARNTVADNTAQEPAFAARLQLAQSTMNIDGKDVYLSPGMTVTAEIKTGTRTVMDYFLSPLARHRQQAIRER